MHMKSIFSILLFAMAFAAAQLAPTGAQAQRYFDLISPASDTLVNQDTIIYTTTPAIIDVPYYYSV